MKVLKFGGTSVGTAESLKNVKKIVEAQAKSEQLIVVVSALGGITDKLIQTARTASTGNLEYIVSYAEIVSRHLQIIKDTVAEPLQNQVRVEINPLLEELGNIFRGISLIKDLSQRTLDVVVSYGERLSSRIISKVITDA
ncbi:MAG: bifunctional aspartate kinase/homoserine dehydrogenase I, partial [Muribaculaceae bacterium]|nr:bifunctional aspartate kinase/homoserine dehydrogenase I [Muribaculaceae bacterium]